MSAALVGFLLGGLIPILSFLVLWGVVKSLVKF